MTVCVSILQTWSRRWISSGRILFLCLAALASMSATHPLSAKQSADRVTTSPIFLLSESSQGSDDVAKAVATALGNPADLRRWTLTFSNHMEPGIRVYANGHDPKPVLDQLGAAGLKAAVVNAPVGVPYSVLTSSKDRIFLIIGPNP
jgi:hypothetical protein